MAGIFFGKSIAALKTLFFHPVPAYQYLFPMLLTSELLSR